MDPVVFVRSIAASAADAIRFAFRMSMNGTEKCFHNLDALRAFALLLGMAFHPAESFEAGHRSWAIINACPNS